MASRFVFFSLALAAALTVSACGAAKQVGDGSSRAGLIAFTVWDAGRLTRSIEVVPSVGGPARVLARHTYIDLAWSPDGKQLSFEKCSHLCDFMDIDVVGADGGSPRRLIRLGDSPAWSPNGRMIAFRDGGDSIAVASRDGRSVRTIVPRTRGLELITDPTWSPRGSQIAFTNILGREGIYLVDANGSGMRRLTTFNSGTTLSWSPDGTGIAFSRVTPLVSYGVNAYLIRSDGSDLHRLAPALKYSEDPVWAPNGQRIAFVGSRTKGAAAIYTIRPDGTGLTRLTPDRLAVDQGPLEWSPDSKRIAFAVGESIYVIVGDGSHVTEIARGGDDQGGPTIAWQPASTP